MANSCSKTTGASIEETTLNKEVSYKSAAQARLLCACVVGAVLLGGLVSGCSQYIDPSVSEPIRPLEEPEFGGEYLLYVPSGYDSGRDWPLVVLFHNRFSDSPIKQMRSWTQFAEERGFILIAPQLGRPKNIAMDERHVLACIRHIRGGYSISDDRILFHGYKTGALAALRVGLKNPQIARAIVLTQPKPDMGFMTEVEGFIDPYQPVFVNYEIGDALTGKHAARCIEWLQAHDLLLTVDSTGMGRYYDSDARAHHKALAFFERILHELPWIQIRSFAAPQGSPTQTQFKLRCSFRPQKYLWSFGDGQQSPISEPTHIYDKPGTYTVTAVVEDPNGVSHKRVRTLRVP